MSDRYTILGPAPRALRGSIAAPRPTLTVAAPPRFARPASAANIAASFSAPGPHERVPLAPGPTLVELQGSLQDLLKGLDAPAFLHTSDGHPIHFDAAAHDPVHHAMSAPGHREAGETLRQAAKLLLHLRDQKHAAGDAKGALLFGSEARRALARMVEHHDCARHKDAMSAHAARANDHAAESRDLARQISGTDAIGPAEHEQARAHPLYARYAAARSAEQRASDGVRHAALAAMGRAGGSTHPLELNPFLGLHGHQAHALADDGDAAPLSHDPEKARLDKTLTGPPSVRGVAKVESRIGEIGARGGRARNLGGRQARTPPPCSPAQLTGRAASRDVAKSAADALHKALVDTHLTAAAHAADDGGEDALNEHALAAMEHSLAGEVASRDGDGDGRIDGPDDGDSDEDPGDPVRPVRKALAPRPLRPDLSVITHRPAVRGSAERSGMAGRALRRFADGSLDLEGTQHAILDALWKLRDGGELTPHERALVAIVLPGESSDRTAVSLGRLSDDERHQLTAHVAAHLLAIAHADAQRTLARSASTWTLAEVRKHLPAILLRDPLGLGTCWLTKAGSPVIASASRGRSGSRGGQVAYTTRSGQPVHAAHARRFAPQMDRMMTNWHQTATRTGDPEHHAIAAKQALAAAFYHHHAGDPVAAEQAMSYADHHLARARAVGHQGRTMRWIHQHHPATAQLLGSPPN